MNSEQPELFSELAEPDLHTGQGKCPLCHRPQMWRPRLQEWSRYCGSGQCNSATRICQNCGDQFKLGIDGAGTKYCSAQCRYVKNFKSYQYDYVKTSCAWCDHPAKYRTRKLQGDYVCNECIEPIKHVWRRLEKHHVPIEMRRRLVSDSGCDICGSDVVALTKIKGDSRPASRLVVDHDHNCCPGALSCGECIRGFLCGNCNSMLGYAIDSVEALEQGAAYLRSHQTKMILRERERSGRS